MTMTGCLALAALTAAGPVERPYAFRERLVTVHRNDRRDLSVTARAADALP